MYNLFRNSNYCKGDLNGFVHETDKKLNCLGILRVLQLTFIHFVMDLRKWKINKNKMITWNRGGQTGDQTRKVSRQRTKSSRIGDPTGHNVEPWRGGTVQPEYQVSSQGE